jgi:hypothetical protein
MRGRNCWRNLMTKLLKKTWVCVFTLMFIMVFSIGFSQETEPEEPEIILPRVILEIEDLSVENISAGIPEGEYIIPGDFEVPLPEPEDLQIEEPLTMMALPQSDGAMFEREEGRYLNFEGILGVGTRNHFMSGFSLYQYERIPEGRLLFEHEITDGFSGEEEGTGFNIRDDRLSGLLRFNAGKLEIETEGSFSDQERGLQGTGDFYSKISRYGDGRVAVMIPIGDRFSLSWDASTAVTAQLLTTSGTPAITSDKTNEIIAGLTLEGRYAFDRGYFGIRPQYTYRDGGEDGSYDLNRVRVSGLFGLEIGRVTQLDAEASWFWSDAENHLFPFHLTLSTYPTDLFSLNLSGGYRVQEYNLSYLFQNYPLVEAPDTLTDNYGWFLDAGTHIHITRDWIVTGALSFMDNNGLFSPVETTDSVTGLFPIDQEDALSLTSEVGLRWNRSTQFSTFVSWIYELLERPQFFPEHSLNLEMSWLGEAGKYGGELTSVFHTGVNDFVQAPVINIQGFYRIVDFIRVGAELHDILYPVLDDPRYSWSPYVDVGLLFVFKTYITF